MVLSSAPCYVICWLPACKHTWSKSRKKIRIISNQTHYVQCHCPSGIESFNFFAISGGRYESWQAGDIFARRFTRKSSERAEGAWKKKSIHSIWPADNGAWRPDQSHWERCVNTFQSHWEANGNFWNSYLKREIVLSSVNNCLLRPIQMSAFLSIYGLQ